ncbi:MAG: prefoldin subunit alpha [Thermoplasmata archaeon]|nr:prefoldin subunit alpha [Thermoplasmata archaeon]
MSAEELQSAVAEYEALRAQLEALAQQNELLRMSLEEHMRAKETMSRFQVGGEGAEILVPVGANSFVFAQISDPDKAIVGIGSDLTVEEDMEDAIKGLDVKIEEIETALKGLTERVVEVSRMVEEKSGVVRGLYGQVQQTNE